VEAFAQEGVKVAFVDGKAQLPAGAAKEMEWWVLGGGGVCCERLGGAWGSGVEKGFGFGFGDKHFQLTRSQLPIPQTDYVNPNPNHRAWEALSSTARVTAVVVIYQ